MGKGAVAAFAVVASLVLVGCIGSPDLVLATTTSTQDSGLLDVLVPAFEEETGTTVGVHAVGSGAALEMGRRGDADVLLVHSPRAERRFMEEGHGRSRTYVFHNGFVLVGPPDDPAGVASKNVSEAFQAIHANRSEFVSRGDDSGTHVRERGLWSRAGLDPGSFDPSWYHRVGQGMGETLLVTDEKGAYTLADEATYRNMSARIDLGILVAGDPVLENPYHTITVTSDGDPFAAWLRTDRARRLVQDHEIAGHQVFFIPGST